MVFSSILFLCLFLPITVLLYDLLPQRLRNTLLLAASLIFYAWGEPRYILIMLFSTVFDYTNGRLLEHFEHKDGIRRFILILSITVNLGLLCFFKYTDFAIENINRLAGTGLGLLELTLPVGISFYTFQTLSYTIDVYRKKVKAQHNIIDFGMYICLFPQLIAGPIVRYTDISEQLKNHPVNGTMRWKGLFRFTIGLGKKVLLANQIGSLWEEISAQPSLPAATAWIGILAFSFQIYFDFSGYSDMAIGLGQMFGFTFPENFRYPYEAASITDFWRRWHITLGTWFREYLYIPLGGNRKGLRRQLANLLLVWMLTGLWHGAGWNFLLWGLFYFILLAFEKIVLLRKMEHWKLFFRHLYTCVLVVLGWVIFACDDLTMLGDYLSALFGKNGFADNMTLYYLTGYGILFVILFIGCTSLPKRTADTISHKLSQRKSGHNFSLGENMDSACSSEANETDTGSSIIYFIIQAIVVMAVLIGSLSFLVGDSYNPFLYFRF